MDTALQLKLLRLKLAGVQTTISQIEEALIGGAGSPPLSDVPGLIWNMRDGIAQAGVMAAEFDQAYNESQLTDLDEFQTDDGEVIFNE